MQLYYYIKSKLNTAFFKKILTLFTGSVVSQTIIFLSIPFLTRLFSTEEFGIYMLFSTSIALLKILISLNFELAIILPKRNKDAINIFVFNLLLILFFSILLLIAVFLFKNNLASFLKIQNLYNYIYLIPISTFLIGNISALEYWNNRNNNFGNITAGVITKSSTMSVSQLLTGVSSFKSIGLIPGLILGQVLNFIVLINQSLKSVLILKKHVSIKRMLFLVLKYRDIPLFNTILTFTNTLSNQLPIILITRFFGVDVAGIYGLAAKVSQAPSGIINKSISLVFFNEASNIYNNDGDLYKLVKSMQKKLFFTALIIFIPIFAISFFLNLIFGENWNEVGFYVRILLPWLFIMFLNSPISSLIEILNKQKSFLIYGIILLVARFLALYLGFALFNNIKISLILFSGVGVIFGFFLFFYFIKISKKASKIKNNAYNNLT